MASSPHFTDQELACKCGCGVNLCTQELVDALESLRALARNVPIRIDSAYRCPAHNSETPNAVKCSQHQLGNAADIVIPGLPAPAMEYLAQCISAIGGIGRADHQGYIHVDVRPRVSAAPWPTNETWGGYGTHWCYDTEGKECNWYPAA